MRGQRAGEFDDRLSAGWLAAVVVQLGHTAGEEEDAGRMTRDEAVAALRTSVLRVLARPDQRPVASSCRPVVAVFDPAAG